MKSKQEFGGIRVNLNDKATEIRLKMLKMIKEAGSGHLGSDLSCVEILVSLYHHVLNVDPKNPQAPDRDRYIQSKGHAAEVMWTVLADRGFFPEEELKTFYQYNSRLIGHPNNEVSGVEMNTGSLGHGLAISVGIALAAKKDHKAYQTYTLLGDGELAEGSVWEAAMAASHFKLDNLTGIIDYNRLQISGNVSEVMNTAPLKEKWEAFGWSVIEVRDGNNIDLLIDAFDSPHEPGKPKMIIAYTVKGKGISFAENQANWHHRVPSDEEYIKAVAELKGSLTDDE